MKVLTVQDILCRKHFENIDVLAGHKGLNRTVKWVHIVEVTKIRKLLNGKELILSTGVAWHENKECFLEFLHQLIESDASGLCIEFGTYTSSIPKEVIELANTHHFPLILFLNEVPFVEITQDIHSYIINQQYEMVSKLEAYSQRLNKKVLSTKHYREILYFLHQYTGHRVIFQLNGKEPEIIPSESTNPSHLHSYLSSCYTSTQSMQLLGNQYGELTIVSSNQEIGEFDLLLLDRTVTALSQHLLRELYVEEKKKAEENEWLKDWVKGEHSNEVINDYLSSFHPVNGGVVCMIRYKKVKQTDPLDLTYFKLLFRTIFEQQGFHPFSIDFGNSVIFILLNKRKTCTWKERMQMGINRIRESELLQKQQKVFITMSVGKFVTDVSLIHQSYETALETETLQSKVPSHTNSAFYDDLHMYRVISTILKHSDLKEVVLEYLEPIIRHDEKYNSKLMETLKVYLACNGSKKEAAKRLFIVRQTLYHRIQKLEALLGKDFMSSEKRLTIEFMMKVYEYMNPNEVKPIVQNE